MTKSQIHPKRNDAGKTVIIQAPSLASDPATWEDPRAVATWTPGSAVPAVLNDVAVAPWTPPSDPKHWRAARGQNATLAASEPAELTVGQTAAAKKDSAGVIVMEPEGRIWLVHPTNRFGGYDVTFPKGRRDPGLSWQQAAIKEAYEEAGLGVRIVDWLGDFLRTTTVTRYYLANRLAGSPADMGWESQAVSLAPLEAADAMLTAEADRPILAALRQHPWVREATAGLLR